MSKTDAFADVSPKEALPEISIDETPAFTVDRYGVVFHYVYRDRRALSASDGVLDSIEHDILAYAYRKQRPFYSATIDVPRGLDRLQILFPRTVRYVAEGSKCRAETPVEALTGDEGRERSFGVCAFRTVFSDRRAVLHLGLTPLKLADGSVDPASTLNEYDLVKLLKLWEGGEGVSEGEPLAMKRQLRVMVDDGEGIVTLDELAQRIVASHGHLDPRSGAPQLRAGTIQLRLGEERWGSIYERLLPIRRGGLEADVGFSEKSMPEATWNDLMALQAVLCGLLHGDMVDDAEMRDSFMLPMNLAADALLAVNKGTMLMVSDECRLGETLGSIVGVNPFLSIPHAALIYNEETLREPLVAVREMNEERDDEVVLSSFESGLSRALQVQYLPNVFHYSRERTLFDHGNDSRRIGALLNEARERLDVVRNHLRTQGKGKERTLTLFLELFVLILTLIQVLGNYEQLYHLATEHLLGFWTCAMVTVVAPFPIYLIANRRGTPMKPQQRLFVIVVTAILFWVSLYWWLIYLAPEPPEGHRPHENVPAAADPQAF